MATLHLIIPDDALREAVTEQLTLAKMRDWVERSSFDAAIKDDQAIVMIIDEAAVDKKTTEIFEKNDLGKKAVFVLGADRTDIAHTVFAKPLRLGHLLERLRYQIEIAPRLHGVIVEFAGLRFESANRQATVIATDAVVRLTEKETEIIATLAQHDAPTKREDLLATIWGYDNRIDTHTLESHLYQLRRKLDVDGTGADLIPFESGGYRLKKS